MKNHTLVNLSAALLGIAGIHTHAQSWETIVELPDASGRSILIDPFSVDPSLPELFIGGSSLFGSILHVDQSSNPATVMPSDPSVGTTDRLTQDAFGNLYAGGNGQIRRSSTSGATWTVVDDAVTWNPKAYVIGGLVADPAGNVYSSGSAFDKRGNEYWVIRKGSNFGQSWAITYKSAKPLAKGMGMAFVAPSPGIHQGGLFAVGSLTATKTTQWSVLRSRDGGASWQWVDAWGTSKANGGAHARAIAADSQGNLYVAGYDAMGVPAWYVRRSVDGGETWQSLLTEYAEGDYSRADDIATDLWGNVYVVGLTQPAGNAAWTIRRWEAATGSWDQWPADLRHPFDSTATVSTARGVTTDAASRVYVTGTADNHWLVQRLDLLP